MTIDDSILIFIRKNPRATMVEVEAKRIELAQSRKRFATALVGEPSSPLRRLVAPKNFGGN